MSPNRNLGFTLPELMLTIGIAAILLGIGIPQMAHWVSRAGVSNAAESIQNGVRLAQAEAVKRNAAIDFLLVNVAAPSATSVTPAATATTGWRAWVIRLASDNSVIQAGEIGGEAASAALSSSSIAVNSLRFNGMGQVTTSAGANLAGPAVFDVRNTTPSVRTARCVYVTPGGAVKVCNPGLSAGSLMSCANTPVAATCAAP